MNRRRPKRVHTTGHIPDLYDTFEAQHRRRLLWKKRTLTILLLVLFIAVMVLIGVFFGVG